MQLLQRHAQQISSALENLSGYRDLPGLYDPIDYILQLGGKRLRPALVLWACEAYGKPAEEAVPAGLAVEVFHNFTLVHDDIMDAADSRRGEPPVHEKWDLNTGILSGDAMLILAYQQLVSYSPAVSQELHDVFGKTALEVCEGQQMDMDFEQADQVSVAKYLEMIRLKTAVLLGAALQMGAIIAGAPRSEQEAVYAIGKDLGLAFQLMDDYLDVYGDQTKFGKTTGGDIIENKKTLLYLLAADHPDKGREIVERYTKRPADPSEKIKVVTEIFTQTGAAEQCLSQAKEYTDSALKTLEGLNIKKSFKQPLRTTAEKLLYREN